MALERIGLGGVLTFDAGQATRNMGLTQRAFTRLNQTVNQVPAIAARAGTALRGALAQASAAAGRMSQGLGQLAGGVRSAGLAMLPFTAGLAFGFGQAVSFERQMDAVGAVAQASTEEMASLEAEARRMGIVSVFSATQAGEAMENMARSGATTAEILGGLEGVMNAASAESIDLATASDLVAQTTRIMGREWAQAANTADILALVSASTNTDMISLGEALRYGGQQARAAGMDLEQTAALLGVFADQEGLRGSIGGTALTNALIQLSSPSDAGAAALERFGIAMTTTESGALDLVDIVQQLRPHIDSMAAPTDRLRILNDIFGIRGARAYQAIANAGEERIRGLEAELRAQADVEEGQGAAAQASRRRLSNLAGAWTLFMSSVESAFITVFQPMLAPLAEAVTMITDNLNIVLQGVNAITAAGDDEEAQFTAMSEIMENHGATFLNIIMGVSDAITDMQAIFDAVVQTVQEFAGWLGIAAGGDMIRQITRIGLLFGVMAGLIAPVLIALGGIAFIVTAVIIPIVTGLWEIIAGAVGAISWPLLAIAAAAGFVFMIIRQDGESFMDTMVRMWSYIEAAALEVWEGGILPFWEGLTGVLMPVIDELGAVWTETFNIIRDAFGILWESTDGATDGISIDWHMVGAVVGEIIATIARVFSYAVQFIAMAFRQWATDVSNFVTGVRTAWGNIMSFLTAVEEFVVGLWVIVSHYAGIAWDWIVAKVASARDWIVGVFAPVGAWFSSLWGDVQDSGGGAWEWISNGATELYNWLVEVFSPLTTFFANLWNSIASTFTEVFGAVMDALGVAVGEVRAVGREAGAGGGRRPTGPATAGPSFAERVAARARASRERAGSEAETELDDLGRRVGERRAAATRRAGETPAVDVAVEVNDGRTISIDNRVCMDGAEVARATERHREEVSERAGFRATPWERRVRVEHGATRLGG
ncbi:MAG: phage tail tape measure protein [Acidimicrobiia bacterium]